MGWRSRSTSIPQGGGGGVPRSAYFVQLLYVRSGHHQVKLSWSSMSKYKRRSVSVYNMFTVMFINDIHGRPLWKWAKSYFVAVINACMQVQLIRA